MTVWSHLRHSARSLTRTPGSTLALLFSIALGIGSNASVAGFVNGLVTRDVPIRGMDAVVSVYARDARGALGPLSYEGYRSLLAGPEVFASLGAARETRSHVAWGRGSSVMSVASVTPDLADMLQFSLSEGVVISHRVWQNEFGGTAIRGSVVSIDGVESRVWGVAPDWLEGLYVGRAIDIWMPLDEVALRRTDRISETFWLLGRLRSGLSPDEAQATINAARSGPDAFAVQPYSGVTPDMAGGISRMAVLLSIASGAVFLVASANVATFLLSRASARWTETAVRVALGASRRQLAYQLLSESALISGVGGACGLLFAFWTADLIPAFFFEQDAESLAFVPDLGGILVASAVCTGITVVCGLIPLLETPHADPAMVLRRENAGPSPTMRRLRAGLVVGQVACCCLLVISTGLLLASFRTALQTNAGEGLRHAILATVQARGHFDRPDLGMQYFHDVEQAALSLPEISSVAWTAASPGTRASWLPARFEHPQLPHREAVMDIVSFTPRSIERVRLPPIAGRMFGGADTARSCRVVVVDELAATDLFDDDAVGRTIQDREGQRVEIIGVVATRPTDELQERQPTIFYYAEQASPPLDRVGPGTFLIPVQSEPVHGVLEVNVVSSSYFEAMGLTTIAGAALPNDRARHGCRVGVMNEEAAQLYFGGHAAGGAVIDRAGRRTEIVGVVRSARLRTHARRNEPTMYLPMSQDFVPRMTMILSARDTREATVASVRRRLEVVPGGRQIPVVLTLDEHLSRTALAAQRIATTLVAATAAIALALGMLGLYGAMSDSARRRRREYAVRIALGAQGWRVIGQVVAEGVRLAATGTIAGMVGALLVGRWLEGLAPGAGSLTLWAWLAAPLVLAGAVAMAGVLPAHQAFAADPLAIMRDE